MTFLWTRSTLFSEDWDLITWWLESFSSHFAILVGSTIYHWSFSGFKADTMDDFTKNRMIVKSINYKLSPMEANRVHNRMKKRWERGSFYDYMYALWLFFMGLFLKTIRKAIPYGEPWGETANNFICHEAIEALPKGVRPVYDRGRANTPDRLYYELLKGGA